MSFNIKLILRTVAEKVIATVLVVVSVGKDLKTISHKLEEQTIYFFALYFNASPALSSSQYLG